jgi:hypothetical protein
MPRFPGRGKKKTKTKEQKDQEQLQSVTGMFRQMDDKFVVIEAQDTRIITLKRSTSTKFLKNGEEIKSEVLKPGDHLLAEYVQDDQGYLTVVNLHLEKEGTEQERCGRRNRWTLPYRKPGRRRPMRMIGRSSAVEARRPRPTPIPRAQRSPNLQKRLPLPRALQLNPQLSPPRQVLQPHRVLRRRPASPRQRLRHPSRLSPPRTVST